MQLNYDKKNNLLFYLFFIHLVSHFIPFERLSLSPDNYSILSQGNNGIENFFLFPNRPLSYIFIEIQNALIYNNNILDLLLIFFSSFLTIYLSFELLRLFFNKKLSFIIIIIYSLLFNKLEIFHSSIMVYINLTSSLYLLSLIIFISYTKNNNYIYLLISLLLYLIAIFSYEIGIFFPFLYLIFCILVSKVGLKRSILNIGPFFLVLFFYLSFRYTGAFGFGSIYNHHSFDFTNIPSGILELFNNILGRYFLRNLIYGIYVFFMIELKWLLLLIFINLVLIYFMYHFLLKFTFKINIKFKTIIFFIILFFFSSLPVIINGYSGGRHLIIPVISFSILILYLLSCLGNFSNIVFLLFFLVGLIACQGNAWAQVISLRINYSLIETLKLNENEINDYKYLVIDTDSFSVNIKHTLLPRYYNKLNTYFGAQTFEDWGLNSKVKLYIPSESVKTFISINKHNKINSILIFDIKNKANYKYYERKTITLNTKDTYIINFDKVFPNGFKYGFNKKSS